MGTTKPSGRLVRTAAAARAGTGLGFIGANVRFEVEYPSFVRFFVVTPRSRLQVLDLRPTPPAEGFGAGAHEAEIGPGPWGGYWSGPGDGARQCERPCYLVAVASPSAALDSFDPWRVQPIAPGFSNPDSLMSWVAREAVGLPDSVAWSVSYRRLTNDQIRR